MPTNASCGVRGDDTDVQIDQCLERLTRRWRRSDDLTRLVERRPSRFQQQDLEDLLFALEVAVDRRSADARLGTDVVHAGAVVPALVKELHGRGEDLLAPVRTALRSPLGCVGDHRVRIVHALTPGAPYTWVNPTRGSAT